MDNLKSVLQNDALLMRTRIEALALVALGVRPMALVFLPAELPDGELLGREIDSKYNQMLLEGTQGTLLDKFYFWLNSRGKTPIENKRAILRRMYDDVVLSHPSYRSLIEAVVKLDLPYLLYEVRPSIRELYICSTMAIKDKLSALMEERDAIKRAAWAKATPSTPYSLLVYPEEQVPSYLRQLGQLLGYPACCIEAYLSDREQGMNVESRSSYTLLELEQGCAETNPLSFILKDFFPCSPNCEEALNKGNECYQRLSDIGSEYGQAYLDLTSENMSRVAKYPAIISAHLDSLKQQQN